MIEYYAQRAQEYERVYHKLERQEDLLLVKDFLRREMLGRCVLELACGTGYWTAAIADVVASIRATDLNEEVLAIARSKKLPETQVIFVREDAYHPVACDHFDAGLACFWWSHIPHGQIQAFLENFHRALAPGSRVVLVDNRYVAGSSTPISEIDDDGNSYQWRELSDGSQHRVMKNFPDRDVLSSLLAPYAKDLAITEFDYFWCASYVIDTNRYFP